MKVTLPEAVSPAVPGAAELDACDVAARSGRVEPLDVDEQAAGH